MLKEEVEKYSKLTGEDGWHVPIIKIGAYLDGYNKGLEVLDKIRAEIENHCGLIKENHCRYCSYCNSVIGVREILEIMDKYKVESEAENEGKRIDYCIT